MEIVGVTRVRNGKEVDEFVVGCPEHNFWYKGKPPLVSGCRECWHAFFYAQWAMAGAKKENLDQLESAINHMKEKIDKGEWDFKPELQFEGIEKDAN